MNTRSREQIKRGFMHFIFYDTCSCCAFFCMINTSRNNSRHDSNLSSLSRHILLSAEDDDKEHYMLTLLVGRYCVLSLKSSILRWTHKPPSRDHNLHRCDLSLTISSEHNKSAQCWTNVRPASQTVAQHWSNTGSKSSVMKSVINFHVIA